MKPLPAAVILSAVWGLSSQVFESHARTCSFESFSCLFELTKPRIEKPIVAFSFMPLAERLLTHTQRTVRSVEQTQVVGSEQSSGPAQLTARFDDQQHLAVPAVEPTDAWPLLEALRPLRNNPHIDGFSHNVGNPNSYVALDYSDIFETGRAPYKGSHGVSLFFRHDF